MNIFVIVLCVAAVLVYVRRSKTIEHERKTMYTLWGLPVLAFLSGYWANAIKHSNISQALWLLTAIFVVLFINTYISKREYDLKKSKDVKATEAGETKKDDVEVIISKTTPPAPPEF